jgi:putative sugar O-methyltransferase
MTRTKLGKIYSDFFFGKIHKKLNVINVAEKKLINELIKSFQELPENDTSNLSGAALKWANNMNRLRELMLNDDPRRFLQWDVIRNTMFVDIVSYVFRELKYLKSSKEFNAYWKNGIIESEIGSPDIYKHLARSSGNLIHHAYHLQQFVEKTGVKVNEVEFVLEFGGGYGSMCRLFKNLGFNNKYLIFDLPPFSLLQQYYLKSLGHRILTIDEFSKESTGILCISEFGELNSILKTVVPQKRNLFIGTWSISETSRYLRDEVFSLLDKFNLFLIAYQSEFGGIDNIEYFKNIQKTHSHIKWHNWEIEHIRGNYYLIGNGISP